MKVINLKINELDELYKSVESGVMLDTKSVLVIGIASGGVPLQNGLFKALSESSSLVNIDAATVLCQRPSTKTKKQYAFVSSFLQFVFKILPYLVLDKLRVYEHKNLSKRTNKQAQRIVKWQQPPSEREYGTVIIIDDAVDSGHSFKLVNDFIQKELDFRQLITSAVVCTQPDPVFKPDIFLYQNVLIRFPWSLDAKK